jgi:hypothetical protein
VRTMSESRAERSRPRSVLDIREEDVRFAIRGLAEGDDADFIGALGVDDLDRNAGEQAKGNEALLLVGEAVILERECCSFEDDSGIKEVEPMQPQIAQALRRAPCEAHRRRVYTILRGCKRGLT